jgi:hypothetical protein
MKRGISLYDNVLMYISWSLFSTELICHLAGNKTFNFYILNCRWNVHKRLRQFEIYNRNNLLAFVGRARYEYSFFRYWEGIGASCEEGAYVGGGD